MAVRVNLHESTCCGVPLKTRSDQGGRFYLACSKCGKEPLANARAPREQNSNQNHRGTPVK